ncbi:MAG: transposase zinc-binding domain-containing protein [Desulfobacteraceae bacterium]|nr:MAG: transposase zinc-binding domain-containing protein [Desulfobacteraceae bacterium]
MGLFRQWFDRDRFKDIFRTHWESFKKTFSRYQSDRYDEVVQKMLGCGDPENGYATYICSKCGGYQKRLRAVFIYHVPKFIRINGRLA